ncbi:hypothetical protein, partial [Azospirillum oleiclasticum]|uniref:hypothetical protein n=1 Tax=Azospirillum oleiclasticum TaxID=2735135 RepID=UPI001B3BC1B1
PSQATPLSSYGYDFADCRRALRKRTIARRHLYSLPPNRRQFHMLEVLPETILSNTLIIKRRM